MRPLRLIALMEWLIPLGAAWVWFCSLQATAWERIAKLACVENYALAVYNQLIWNYAHRGVWEQTVHYGYVDHWMWSGHRSLWIWAAGWLYRLDPGPLLLVRLQIGLVALGAIPAYGLGRLVFSGGGLRWAGSAAGGRAQGMAGGLIGLALYLGYPPLMAVALNDYQDLILGVPFALAAIWACRAGNLWAFLLAGFACCAAREEWAMLMPLIGLATPGPWQDRLRQMGWGLGLTLGAGAVLLWLGRDFTGHDNPMTSHMGGLVRGLAEGLPPFTRTWADFDSFYSRFFLPLQAVALLAPLTLIPIAGTLVFHLSAPPHGGVDVQWLGHIHHMAPTCAFAAAAAIEGAGRLAGWLPLGRWRTAAVWALAVGALAVAAGACAPWMRYLKISPRFTMELPAAFSEGQEAPEWALIRQIPADAVVTADVHTSLIISSRPVSFTYDESLEDKRPGKGLSVTEYLLVKKVDTGWNQKARSVSGYERVGETDRYVLYRFPRP